MDHITRMVQRQVERMLAQQRPAMRAQLGALELGTRVQRAGMEALAGEPLDNIELFQQFGFTSAPPEGTELVFLPLGGRSSASVIVATQHGASRIALDERGETRVYNQWGDFVHFRKDRTIHVKAQEKVLAETKVFRVEASERIELVSPQLIAQLSTSARFETPVVQATQLLQPQQLTVGAVPGGVGAAVATMTGGTVNFQNVTFTYQNSTLTFAGGSLTHNGRNIGGGHQHPETGSLTDPPNP